MASSTMRANIRIEIHNNLAEPMEVDEQEEGEINETNNVDEGVENQEQEIAKPGPTQRIWPNADGGFTTGINIFDKEEQTKLVERAKRFALRPDEIHNFTDEELQELHDSLGITTEEEKDVRFEAIHMRGTDDMSTEDVLEYFGKYGPAGIEWINDESCNVVWNDKISAARALFFLSKQVKGMPVEGPCDPFLKELKTETLENGRSILLKNTEDQEDVEEGDAYISDITVPIPPGFWRLGLECRKSKYILLRFAFKTDKKPFRAEKFSEYYKKHGNPNFGGMRGLITESRKRKIKGIFDRNKDIDHTTEDPKNPWGTLAKNWYEDVKYCEKDSKSDVKTGLEKSGIMNRLGFKRAVGIGRENTQNIEKKTKVPRMRMYADEEEEKIRRKRQLQKTKNLGEYSDDLRSVLKTQSRKTSIKVEPEESQVDLGTKLKNRHKKTVDNCEFVDHKKDSKKFSEESEKFKSEVDRSNKIDYYEENMDNHKPKSKIAVVIKTQKRPMVASSVWSRINAEEERLKTVSEGKLRIRRDSSSHDSENSSNSSSSTSFSTSDGEEQNNEAPHPNRGFRIENIERPGFKSSNPQADFNPTQHRSLRIEISNNHFKK